MLRLCIPTREERPGVGDPERRRVEERQPADATGHLRHHWAAVDGGHDDVPAVVEETGRLQVRRASGELQIRGPLPI